jgi:hypothetical protein
VKDDFSTSVVATTSKIKMSSMEQAQKGKGRESLGSMAARRITRCIGCGLSIIPFLL